MARLSKKRLLLRAATRGWIDSTVRSAGTHSDHRARSRVGGNHVGLVAPKVGPIDP